MNSKLWIKKALTMCLLTAITVTYSTVALAGSDKAYGELTIIGGDDTASVTVNGEPAKSGRTVFSSSTITTPEGMSAVLNLNKAGKVEIAPNSTFTLNFDGTAIGGDLNAGSITVLNAAKSVGVKTLNGETVTVNAGETASAIGGAAKQTNKKTSSGAWFWWVLIAGGAAVAIIWAASSDNDARLGGGVTTVSPVR